VTRLSTFSGMNSLRINSKISAANIHISSESEKKDVYWKSSLTREEISEYGRLSRKIKNLILKKLIFFIVGQINII
jgi:hypothetical protein